MAQARVTDYFSQSKKAGIDRALRSKSHKTRSAAEELVVSEVRSFQSRSSANKPRHSEQLKSVQEEFCRLIDEAVSAPDHPDNSSGPHKEEPTPVHESPRTPKRTAQSEPGSGVLVSATELHSTAKKRRRVAKDETAKIPPRSARKKLILSKHGETHTVRSRFRSRFLHYIHPYIVRRIDS